MRPCMEDTSAKVKTRQWGGVSVYAACRNRTCLCAPSKSNTTGVSDIV